MPTIKELVQREAESLAKARKLKESIEKAATQIKQVHDIAAERRTGS